MGMTRNFKVIDEKTCEGKAKIYAGSGCHITLPFSWRRKKVRVILLDD